MEKTTAEAALLAYVAGTIARLAPCSSAILVSRRGELLMERYDRGPHPQGETPVNAASLWPYWSISKSFAAALVARLWSEGAFDPDAPLGEYLEAFLRPGPAAGGGPCSGGAAGPFDRRLVTPRHLMSHTSGLSIPGRIEDGVNLGTPPDLDDLTAAALPGSTFEYSSLGMHVLELCLEAAAGEDYGAVLRRRILEPFGLPSVDYLYPDSAAERRASALPCADGEIVFSQPRQRCGLGLYGTARDLLRFGERWLTMADPSDSVSPPNPPSSAGSPCCDSATRSQIWTRHSTRASDGSDYGLLWWLFPEQGGVVASGASYGVCALVPDLGIAAVVARNHYGPAATPFDYRADKIRILELARAFI